MFYNDLEDWLSTVTDLDPELIEGRGGATTAEDLRVAIERLSRAIQEGGRRRSGRRRLDAARNDRHGQSRRGHPGPRPAHAQRAAGGPELGRDRSPSSSARCSTLLETIARALQTPARGVESMAARAAARVAPRRILAELRRRSDQPPARLHLPAVDLRAGAVPAEPRDHRQGHGAAAPQRADRRADRAAGAGEGQQRRRRPTTLATLQASLAAAESERDRLRGLLDSQSDAAQLRRRAGSPRSPPSSTTRSRSASAPFRRSNCSTSRSRRCAARSPRSKTPSTSPSRRDKESQTQIADLGRRLNVALAQRVQELSRYRSDFFGRLREILGDRPDIRIVGDRFVFQSEVLFATGSDEINDRGQGRARQAGRARSSSSIQEIPTDIPWVLQIDGHTDKRPITGARPLPLQLGPVGRPRHLGGASSSCSTGHPAGPAGRRRLRRVPAARGRRHRRRLRQEPPHRAEADRALEPRIRCRPDLPRPGALRYIARPTKRRPMAGPRVFRGFRP